MKDREIRESIDS